MDEFVLRMAEESGEVEEDLPPLNPTEVLGRVGFPVLALVRSDKGRSGKVMPRRKLSVTVLASASLIKQACAATACL